MMERASDAAAKPLPLSTGWLQSAADLKPFDPVAIDTSRSSMAAADAESAVDAFLSCANGMRIT